MLESSASGSWAEIMCASTRSKREWITSMSIDPIPENAARMKEFATVCSSMEELFSPSACSQHLRAHQVSLRDG